MNDNLFQDNNFLEDYSVLGGEQNKLPTRKINRKTRNPLIDRVVIHLYSFSPWNCYVFEKYVIYYALTTLYLQVTSK